MEWSTTVADAAASTGTAGQGVVPRRYGMSVPFGGIPLGEQRDLVKELEDLDSARIRLVPVD